MPVDNRSSSQEQIVAASSEVSALNRVWHTPGYPRFIYGAYLILGIIFCGFGIFTALSLLMTSLNNGTIAIVGTALFLCYMLINIIIGYGFLFYRRWLLTAFSSTLALLGIVAIFFFTSGEASRAAGLLISIYYIAGILLFLFLTKRFLSGRYLVRGAIIPFIALLVSSLILTNLSVLQ